MDIYISVKRDQDDTHAATRVSDRNDCTILPFGFRLVVSDFCFIYKYRQT